MGSETKRGPGRSWVWRGWGNRPEQGRDSGCGWGALPWEKQQEPSPRLYPWWRVGGSSQSGEGPRKQSLCPARQVSGPSQWCTWCGRQACPFSPEQSRFRSRRPSGLQGREDGKAADGPRVSDFQSGVGGVPGVGGAGGGAAQDAWGGGSGFSPPFSGPSQPQVPEGGWEGQSWGLGGTVCPPPLPPRAGQRGSTSPRPD